MMKTGVDARVKPREDNKNEDEYEDSKKKKYFSCCDSHADDTCSNVCNGRTGCHEYTTVTLRMRQRRKP